MIKNLKKVISSIAAVAILASSASAFALTFPDVDDSASYANAVNTLTALGVINGDENGKFNPDNTVTRAEFTKMVVEALGEGDSATALTSSQFTDAAGHWAVGYIAQGVSKGFINGYDEATFGPDDTVTFAQAVKMLVCAIGYDTYATQQGGWPSGYMAYGSSLKIINGVSGVNNDTALTRAQCAVLINNAMKAPLCVIDRYEYAVGLNGTVAVPVLDVKDGEGKEYQTLLTDKHDAYVAKGRVINTAKNVSGLEAGEVEFKVEVADNFDEKFFEKHNTDNYDMFVGNTNAEDLLFTYAEIVAQLDEDADEWTILSITPYGNSKTVDFIADDVADNDKAVGTATYDEVDYVDFAGASKIPVYKSASSNATTKYDLASDVSVYVNGVEMIDMGAVDDDDDDVYTDEDLNILLDEYLIKNPTGQVTLVDATDEASTTTDGDYDYIMITCYRDAVVDTVSASSSSVKVYFKEYDNNVEQKWTWDPEDEDMNIVFTLDGEEIAYTDLQENDVLSIAYNEAEGFVSSTDFEVLVSRNVVTGSITSRDAYDGGEGENTVRVDGTDIKANAKMVQVSAETFEYNTEYNMYLDAFGLIAYVEEGSSSKNYGIIVGMYTSAGNDYPTVRMITSAGEVVAYECKDTEAADAFVAIIDPEGETDANDDGTYTKSEINTAVGVENAVVEYTLSGGKIKYKESDILDDMKGGEGLEFKASSSKLASWAINDSVTKIIDMDAYLNGSDATVSTMTVESFENEGLYDAYLYDKNNDGTYRFAIVLGGTASLREDASLAVVMKNPGRTEYNDEECLEAIVAVDGAEDVVIYIEEDAADVKEGDVIVYRASSNGIVEDGNIEVVYEAETSYAALLGTPDAETNFSSVLSFIDEEYNVTYGETQTEEEIKLYFGPVYSRNGNNITLVKATDENNYSDLDNEEFVEEFTMDNNTVVYTYDYEGAKGYKVSLGQVPSTSKSFWSQTFVLDEDGDKTDVIDWAKVASEDVAPNFALVKVVDGDVAEVVVYVAE